jgi:hypothetical protein
MTPEPAFDEMTTPPTEVRQRPSELYRSVGHWDCPAMIKNEGKLYPCRLVGSLVGQFAPDAGDADTGSRVWAAQALGLPGGLSGDVTVTVSGAVPIDAHLSEDGVVAGEGVPWLLAGETAADACTPR